MGLEVFKENSFAEKLKVFFDFADLDNNGKLTHEELYNVLKRNFSTAEEKLELKKIIKDMFKMYDENGDGNLDKDELMKACSQNTQLKILMEQSLRNYRTIDKIIDNDLSSPNQNFVPISSNMIHFKEGIHFPLVDKLVHVFKENEETHENAQKLFSKLSLDRRKLKLDVDALESNLSEDDDTKCQRFLHSSFPFSCLITESKRAIFLSQRIQSKDADILLHKHCVYISTTRPIHV
eukprot:TRINITY_DN2672_c0_g1_i1.p1 TRINITY_DN2672_c0_g1~~TRINITY_DN2672_c0_g1_i1.p1  ORF type:complete len:236 (+),score=37.87 TRINITY_DN2672_c0_g1_i1:908-1615(+)